MYKRIFIMYACLIPLKVCAMLKDIASITEDMNALVALIRQHNEQSARSNTNNHNPLALPHIPGTAPATKAIHAAANSGNARLVELLLIYDPEPFAPNEAGDTIVSIALVRKDLRLLEKLTPYIINIEVLQAIFIGAAEHAMLNLMQTILTRSIDVNWQMPTGETALFVAVQSGHLAIIDFLLQGNADVDKGPEHESSLTAAAARDATDILEMLLPHAQKPEILLFWIVKCGKKALLRRGIEQTWFELTATDGLNNSALHHAARCGQEECLDVLLDTHVFVNAQNKRGETPLMLAASQGHEAMVKKLIDSASSLNTTDMQGMTALGYAVVARRISIMRELLRMGASTETAVGTVTPLMYAATAGDTETVEYLLGAKAKLLALDKEGNSLFLAILGNNSLPIDNRLSMIQRIIGFIEQEHKQNTAYFFSHLFNTPNQAAINAFSIIVSLKRLDLIKKCITLGAQLDTQFINGYDEQGFTSLMRAAYNGDLEFVIMHLTANADLLLRSKSLESSPGNVSGSAQAAKAAQAPQDCGGKTSLMLASQQGHAHIVQALIEALPTKVQNMSIHDYCSLKDDRGRTALMYAVENDHKEVVKQLIVLCFDVNHKDKSGDSAYSLAIKADDHEMLKLLVILQNQQWQAVSDDYKALIPAGSKCSRIFEE